MRTQHQSRLVVQTGEYQKEKLPQIGYTTTIKCSQCELWAGRHHDGRNWEGVVWVDKAFFGEWGLSARRRAVNEGEECPIRVDR